MANFLTVAKIKSSQKQGRDIDKLYNSEQHSIERAVYAIDTITINSSLLDKLTEVEAARYCVNNSAIDNSNKASSFYVVTINSNNTREAINVSDGISELVSYLLKNSKDEHSKEYYAAVAGVIEKIKSAINNKNFVGYTFNAELANKFVKFKYSVDMDINDLEKGWNDLGTTQKRKDILQRIFNVNISNFLPSTLEINLIASNHPFNTLNWRLTKYALERKMKIDSNVYKLINKFPTLPFILEDGNNLQGLDLNSYISFVTILCAVEAGEEYINELRTDNGWLNAEQMEAKFEEHKEIFDKSMRILKSTN